MNIPEQYATDETLADAYRRGFAHGHGIACHNVPRLGQKLFVETLGRIVVDADNIQEAHEALCFEAEQHSRSYSPFEYTAAEFNHADDSEKLWEAFEQGTTDAIFSDLAAYTPADYGIKEEC